MNLWGTRVGTRDFSSKKGGYLGERRFFSLVTSTFENIKYISFSQKSIFESLNVSVYEYET